MAIQTQRFVRNEFPVDGIQVTEKNMGEVARWCSGRVKKSDGTDGKKHGTRYVQVKVNNPINDKQTRAYPGDWVLHARTGFKVYTDHAFHNNFHPAEPELATPESIQELVEKTNSSPSPRDLAKKREA